MNIYLVGMPGSGKSSVGWALADILGRAFVDLDREVEEEAEISIDEIFEREGEPGFRARETAALERIAAAEQSVVACGGGAVVAERNRHLLASTGVVVYLQASLPRLRERVRVGTPGRPLLRGERDLERLLEERDPLYKKIADHVIAVEGDPESLARAIREVLA